MNVLLPCRMKVGQARWVVAALLSLGEWSGGVMSLKAQEALRAANAGADAVTVRQQATSNRGHYNLAYGDVSLRFTGGMGAEYTDNANLISTGNDSDLIFSPSLSTRLLWPITDQNALNLTLDVGYRYYVENPGLSRLYVTPDSELALDLYVGDFVFNLHERPSLSQHAYQDPTVSGAGDLVQLQNTAGVSGLWRLHKATAALGYDHNNYWSLNAPSATGQRDGSAELIYASAGVYVQPEFQLGIQAGAGWIQYNQNSAAPNAFQWNVGGYAKYQASQYLSFRGSAGGTVFAPASSPTSGNRPNTTVAYVDLALTHRINPHLTCQFSGGRGVDVSFSGVAYENYYAHLDLDWHILRKITLRTPFHYIHGTELYGNTTPFHQFQTGITLGRELTEKISGSLGYHYIARHAKSNGGDYIINSIDLIFTCQF